jgi:hypothetical protein
MGETTSDLYRPSTSVTWAIYTLWLLFFAALVGTVMVGLPLPSLQQFLHDAEVGMKYAVLTLQLLAWFITAWGLTRE